jgi:hypothetical protein
MIRAFALGLAVATIQPIVGAFFATQGLTHLDASRVLPNRVLAWLYDAPGRGGGLDRPHEPDCFALK